MSIPLSRIYNNNKRIRYTFPSIRGLMPHLPKMLALIIAKSLIFKRLILKINKLLSFMLKIIKNSKERQAMRATLKLSQFLHRKKMKKRK